MQPAHGGRIFHTLDGIRGIAALAVAVRHCDPFFTPLRLPSGYLAVDLFFALSGFVIAHAYQRRLETGMSAGRFLWVRLVRLYPLYLLGIALGLLDVFVGRLSGGWGGWSHDHLAAATASAALMLPSPVAPRMPHPYLYPFNLPAWSLFFELLINGIYVLVWRCLTLRALVGIVIGSGLVLTGMGLEHGHLNFGSAWDSSLVGLTRVTFAFFAGVLTFRVVAMRPIAFHIGPLPLIAALIAVFTVAPSQADRAAFDIACVLFVFPALIALAAGTTPGTRTTALFGVLGAMSYAVYALHFPLFHLCQAALRWTLAVDPDQVAPIMGWVFLPVLALVCWIADRFYDGPVRRALLARTVHAAPARGPA